MTGALFRLIAALAFSLLLAARLQAAPALITYGGDVVLGTFSSITMELGGTARGTGYDAIDVAGKLTFAGTMHVALFGGFQPAQGDTFNLFDWGTTAGTFGTINLPPLGQYLAWDTSQLYATGVLRVVSTLLPIQQWRLAKFGFPTNTGLAANAIDADFDGIVNLLEYALFLDPHASSTPGLPTVDTVEVGGLDYLTITFRRPLSATDLGYVVQVSPDLATWFPGSSYASTGDVPSNANTTQVSRTDDGTLETITVRDNTPLGTGRRFLRVSVTVPPE